MFKQLLFTGLLLFQFSSWALAQCTPDIDTEVTTISCSGGDDGEIQVTVSNVLPPFEIVVEASNGIRRVGSDSLLVANNLSAGTYDIFVLEPDNGCSSDTIQASVDEPSDLTVDISYIVEPSCGNSADGSAGVIASGGTPPYTYLWSDAASSTTPDVFGLWPGFYEVTVTDANGCTATTAVTILDAVSLFVDVTNIAGSCTGVGTGGASLQTFGGQPPYLYNWSDGVTTSNPDRYDLLPGVYVIFVIDGNGCDFVTEFEVDELELDVSVDVINANCSNTGSILIQPQSGSAPYTVAWSDGGPNILSRDDLFSGEYTFTVTSNEGCTTEQSAFIGSSLELAVAATYADCDSLGATATASVSAAANNPVFQWSNGGTGPVQTGLSVGGYSVTVTDDNGCRSHRNVVVERDTTCYLTISGYAYIDPADSNCQVDSASVPLRYKRIELSNGQVAFTNYQGYYKFDLDKTGIYTINYAAQQGRLQPLCADPIVVNADTYTKEYGDNNFYLDYSGDPDLFFKISKGFARPGFDHWIRICLMNKGGRPGSGTLIFNYNDIELFQSVRPDAESIDTTNREIRWDFADLRPGQIFVYRVKFKVPATVPLGTVLDYHFEAIPNGGDEDVSDNKLACSVVTRGAYDPNDKQVTPMGDKNIGLVLPDNDRLTYQVRFQNTGTDTAFTVVVLDTLDRALDPESILAGPSSHDYSLALIDGHVLEFTFNNIYLPDSNTNLLESQGFLFYEISPFPDQTPGTTIHNSAAIYFDYNAPVITNTVLNTIGGPPVFTEIDTTACAGLTLNGQFYDQSVSLIDTVFLPYYDSIVMADIQILPVYELDESASLCAGNSFDFHGELLTTSGDYQTVLQTTAGCDSIINLSLTVADQIEQRVEVDLCYGESFGGTAYFADTELSEQFTTAAGCDSLVIYELRVAEEAQGSLSAAICAGSSYDFHGEQLTASGDYQTVLQTAAGCDSTINLSLTVADQIEQRVEVDLCYGENFGGSEYFADTELSEQFTTAAGCDSLVIYELRVAEEAQGSLSASICAGSSYDFHGEQLTASGDYQTILQTAAGCDSTINLSLTVAPVIEETRDLDLCFGDDFNGLEITSDTIIQERYTTTAGCDSLVRFQLSVNDEIRDQESAIICAGSTYHFEGNEYDQTGTYETVLTSISGCDSIRILALEVVTGSEENQQQDLCRGDDFLGRTLDRDTVIRVNYINQFGCDSMINYSISIQESDDLFLQEFYCENEATTAAGTYVSEYINQYGCDSIVTREVIHWPVYETDTTLILQAGSAYQGQVIESDTSLLFSLKSVQGCDSLVQVNIVVENTTSLGDLTAFGKIQVYPNPVQDLLQVELEFLQDQTVDIRIYDPQSKAMKATQHWFGKQGRAQVDMRGLAAGYYLLVVQTDLGVWTRPLVKVE